MEMKFPYISMEKRQHLRFFLGVISPSKEPFMLGQNPTNGGLPQDSLFYYFPMQVYSVMIYDRALTELEIKKNYEIHKMRFEIEQ